MRHWLQLATRDLRARRVRTLGAVLAVALGTGTVIWVMCCYESVRQTVTKWSREYVGKAQINIESPLGKYSQFSASLVARVAELPNVASVTPLLAMRLRGYFRTAAKADDPTIPDRWTSPELDLHGIDLDLEPHVRDYTVRIGRMLEPSDNLACVIEQAVAEEQGLQLGDSVFIWGDASDKPVRLQVVGMLERKRIARFQKTLILTRMPALQKIALRPQQITSLDIVLKDQSPKATATTMAAVRRVVQKANEHVNVRGTEARMEQVEKAQEQQRGVVQLMSCVAMLTALCIMLSTLSMGMVERVSMLGLLRCVGMTGTQLAWLVLGQILPLGISGIVLGVPIGLGLARATVWIVPDYLGTFAVSYYGIAFAVVAGLVSTFVAALLPASAAITVSPLEASRPRARRSRPMLFYIAFFLGAVAFAAQLYITKVYVQRNVQFVDWSTAAVILLYLSYALAAPMAVWLVGSLAVHLIARIVGVQPSLLQDQIGHAVWRSAGIVCALMVGLSMIVGLSVFNYTFQAGWQFPKDFPEAFVFTYDQNQTPSPQRVVMGVEGVKTATITNAVNPIVEERNPIFENLQRSVTWFMGIDPDSFFDIVRFNFVDGDEQTARQKMAEGGYLIIASDFARTRSKGVQEVRDDKGKVVISNVVRCFYDNRWTDFKVAAVIESPALDIAAGYFQAETEMRVAAHGSVLGSNKDLREKFGVRGFKLVLLNFDVKPTPVPENWPPPRDTAEGQKLDPLVYDNLLPLDRRWQRQRETNVLKEVAARLNAPQARIGTIRELKDEIDRELTRVTRLLTAVPAVALVIAALGVANLMAANIANRTKQLAILRAVGATQGLILRMVLGEALVLGFLGSVLGLALGLHLAENVTTMASRMWGFEAGLAIPWQTLGVAIALTVALCILAGIVPARHASRTNVIDALHVP